MTGPFVLDASVALKWFFTENHGEAARRLRGVSSALHVPRYFMLEVGHVACKKYRRGEVSVEEVLQVIQHIRVAPLHRHDDGALLPRALELALGLRAGLYDSMYLALAVELDCPFVTADRRFVSRAMKSDYASHVLWIEDLPAA